MSEVDISIVVPLFNEEKNVELLHERITSVLTSTSLSFEILFVDDGSSDRTLQLARELSKHDGSLRVIEFRANYGQTPAMAAGIELATGRIIATMDGDLQNNPSDIPAMYDQLTDDIDMVVGWRENRKDKFLSRKVPSWIANRLIGKVTGVSIRDNGCSLKLYRAKLIKKVPLYSEMHRFIPAMASIAGARVKQVPVCHHARKFGESKYGLSRTYKVLLDLLAIKTIIGFAQRPLIWFGMMAAFSLLVSLVALVYALWPTFSVGGHMSLIFAGVSLFSAFLSLSLLMSGAVCELVFWTGDIRPTEYSMTSITPILEVERYDL